MDLLRAGSLLVVVAGHWLGEVPTFSGGAVAGLMVYDVEPAYWPVTWIFQVIPLFFFVGGFANATSYRRLRDDHRESEFIGRRLGRLLRPTLVFLGFWVLVEAVLTVLDAGGPGPLRGMRWGYMTPFAPLWFLGVYIVLVLLVPVTLRLHERLGLAVPVILVAGVFGVDCMAFGLGRPHLLGINIVLAWLLPHQLGYLYADGRLQAVGARTWLGAAAGLLALLLLLTSLPWYGRNLLDNGVTVVGITTPTLPFTVFSLAAIATALAARPRLVRWLRRPDPAGAVTRLTPVAMTVFLWHVTAYFGAVALVVAAGLPLPTRPDLTWWVERPLFLLLPALLLAPIVLVFARFEGAMPRPAPLAPV